MEDAGGHIGHVHQHGRPGYLRLLTAAVGLLLVFSAVVSGGIYHWSRDLFVISSLALLVFSLPGPETPRLRGFWPAPVLLAVAALSAIWTINVNNTVRDAFALAGFAAFAYLSALAGADKDARRRLLWSLFVAAVLISIYGIYQYFIGFTHTEQYLRQAGSTSGLSGEEIAGALYALGGKRTFSTLLSPDVLACYLAVAFPVGLSLMLTARRHWAVYAAGLTVIFAALLLTKSVGGLAALASGALVFIFAGKGAKWGIFSRRGILALGLTIAIAAGSVYGVTLLRRGGPGIENSISQRYDYWSGAVAMFMDSPLRGRGAGSFEILYPGHVKPGTDETRYAHDLLLQTMAETGLLGFAAVSLVFIVFFTSCSRKLNEPEGGVLTAGAMAGGAAFFVHNLADYTYYVHETAVVFWFLFGLSASGGEDAPAAAPGRAWLKVLPRALAAAIAITIGFFYIKSCIAGSREAEAAGTLRSAGMATEAAALINPAPLKAVRLAGDAVRLKPYDDRYHAFLAGLYEGRATLDGPEAAQKAIASYSEAIRLNPYYPFHYRDLGILYLRLGDKGKARENFKKAVSLYPASENLKKYLYLTGN